MAVTRRSSLIARHLMLSALLGFAPALSSAQVILGRVVEDQNGQPIKHATLELIDDRAHVVTRVAVDTLGVFRIRSWHAGKFRLKTTAIGYTTVSSDAIELATGDKLELTIKLATNAVPLEPIVIKARARETLAEIAMSGYYDRRDSGKRLGLGRFYDRGEIDRRGRKLTDVLSTIPGVRVLYVQNCPVPLISMAGNSSSRLEDIQSDQLVRMSALNEACKPASVCRANVYIDGVMQSFDETISINQTVPMEWVEAIEVYRRASEVPAEFLGRATCGVVAVWTRRG